eukprot:8064791-Pyramimonas_sp.AAC.1
MKPGSRAFTVAVKSAQCEYWARGVDPWQAMATLLKSLPVGRVSVLANLYSRCWLVQEPSGQTCALLLRAQMK